MALSKSVEDKNIKTNRKTALKEDLGEGEGEGEGGSAEGRGAELCLSLIRLTLLFIKCNQGIKVIYY